MELIVASIMAFASTNIDDIFVLMLFFANKNYKVNEVIIGQYLGIGVLIIVSFIGSFVGLFLPTAYIGLLGILPIFLGMKSLVNYYRKKKSDYSEQESPIVFRNKGSLLSVAAVTLANGGDNIGIYIPLFATLALTSKLIMITIFLLLVAVWCYVGWYLSEHPAIARAIDKYGHIVTPIVLILLGLYILYESGTLALFAF